MPSRQRADPTAIFKATEQPQPGFEFDAPRKSEAPKDKEPSGPAEVKVRDKVVVPTGTAEAEVLAAAKASEKVQEYLAGKAIVREIMVPDRLVNLVVR